MSCRNVRLSRWLLEIEPVANTSSNSPFQGPPPEGILNKIFLNEKGLRGGWRLLIYAGFVAVLGFGGGFVLQHFIHSRGGFSFGYSFNYAVVSFIVVFGAALIMSRVDGPSSGAAGLPLRWGFGEVFRQR